MKHYTKILFLILLILCFSCKPEVRNKAFINSLATIQNGLPSPYFNYYLYFKTDKGKIMETNIDAIYQLYKDYYSVKYKNFEDFLEKLFLKIEVVKEDELVILKQKKYSPLNTVTADKVIEKMEIENIEKVYLEKDGQNFILRTNRATPMKIRTILFKMFTENYIISPSDLAGYYTITKYNEKDFK